MAPWREIASHAQVDSAVDDCVPVPDEIVATIDELASRWRFSEDDMTPERREQLLVEFAALEPNTMLKRLHEKDETLFRGPNDA